MHAAIALVVPSVPATVAEFETARLLQVALLVVSADRVRTLLTLMLLEVTVSSVAVGARIPPLTSKVATGAVVPKPTFPLDATYSLETIALVAFPGVRLVTLKFVLKLPSSVQKAPPASEAELAPTAMLPLLLAEL